MCGIVGYIGRKKAAPILLKGLKRLEYRGYDSAGIAILKGNTFETVKRAGRVEGIMGAETLEGTLGIGHTRWATHGAPSVENAHPHCYKRFAIVHNGIIENYESLKAECLKRGEVFLSETDSEVVAHLLEFYYKGEILTALRKTADRLTGSYALAVLCLDEPNVLALCRKKSPLIVGMGENGCFAASDLPAVGELCANFYALEDGEFALLHENQVDFYDKYKKIIKKPMKLDLDGKPPTLTGYSHYMRKEMAEIPTSIQNTLAEFESKMRNSEFCEVLCQTEYFQIVACGTAYHSGISAKYGIEALARIPVEVSIASEYRYSDPILRGKVSLLAISQSGETADTLAAAELVRRRGAKVIGITNAPHSSLCRISDLVFETKAGQEIGVAATKSFNAQLALLYSLAGFLAKARGRDFEDRTLRELPDLAQKTLSSVDQMKAFAPEFAKARSVYFIGRGADYCAAIEGSLKLKEISYLPSEGYPAGELKHGTLALMEPGTPVVAVLTQRALAEKTMNAVSEVYARGGKVLLVTSLPEYAERREVWERVLVPTCFEPFSPILTVIPLQALAYFCALERGNDPDKPRNLAKSVTVE